MHPLPARRQSNPSSLSSFSRRVLLLAFSSLDPGSFKKLTVFVFGDFLPSLLYHATHRLTPLIECFYKISLYPSPQDFRPIFFRQASRRWPMIFSKPLSVGW